MSAPPAERATSNDPQVLLGNQGDVDGFHPDVLAYAEREGGATPYRLRWLQRQYDRGLLRRVAAEDDVAVVTRLIGRGGSVPVDNRVGERVARRLTTNAPRGTR